MLLTACAHDGRTLRPPVDGQTQSIVTTSTSTTGAPSIGTVGPTAAAAVVATTAARAAGQLTLSLPWADNGTIDPIATCKGAGARPAVSWAEAPAGAKEMALTVIDDTAAGYVHWVVAGIDPAAGTIGPTSLPATAAQGLNGAGTKGWTPPCPPAGSTHKYRFTLYALSAPSGLVDGADSRTALAAVQRNVLALDVTFGLVAG